MDAGTIAGTLSTVLFAGGLPPMVWRAARTRDLSSYSRGSLAVSNVGNLVHTVYVVSLPAGPLWFLHAVYLVVTAQMFVWKVLDDRRRAEPASCSPGALSGPGAER